MYSLGQIIRGIRYPRRGLLELNKILHRRILKKSGVDVMDEEWDNLVILDACRYTDFRSESDIEGELQSKISKGSHTSEFLTNNFRSREFPETVYVSATPQVTRHSIEDNFHRVVNVWENRWDEETETVLPVDVVEAAIKSAERWPNKRVIVHFIQPHYPFLGETGKQLKQIGINPSGDVGDRNVDESLWDRLEDGAVERSEVYRAYLENLRLVLPHVKELLENLVGRTVVTSDHGNSFGRLGIYGHPSEYYMSELVEVPWLVVDSGERKVINSEGTSKTEDGESELVNDRLRSLGYIE